MNAEGVATEAFCVPYSVFSIQYSPLPMDLQIGFDFEDGLEARPTLPSDAAARPLEKINHFDGRANWRDPA